MGVLEQPAYMGSRGWGGGTHRWVWQLQDDLGASGLSWCWGRGGGQDGLMKRHHLNLQALPCHSLAM